MIEENQTQDNNQNETQKPRSNILIYGLTTLCTLATIGTIGAVVYFAPSKEEIEQREIKEKMALYGTTTATVISEERINGNYILKCITEANKIVSIDVLSRNNVNGKNSTKESLDVLIDSCSIIKFVTSANEEVDPSSYEARRTGNYSGPIKLSAETDFRVKGTQCGTKYADRIEVVTEGKNYSILK